MEEPLFRTDKLNPDFLKFVSLGLAAGFGSYTFFGDVALEPEYKDLSTTLGIICLILSVFFLVLFIRQNLYEIFADKVRVFNVLGMEKAVIPIKDFKSWTEDKRDTWVSGRSPGINTNPIKYSLTLYTSQYKIKIKSEYMADADYQNLKKTIISQIPQERSYVLKHIIGLKKQSLAAGAFAACAVVFLLYWYKTDLNMFVQGILALVLLVTCFLIYDSLRTISQSKDELEKLPL